MKLILISDLHLLSKQPKARLDNAVETCFKKLAYVVRRAYGMQAPILVAGDFFDQPRDWYVFKHLIETISGVEIYSIFGQHDTYKYSEKTRSATNLGVLSALSDDVTILEAAPTKLEGVRVYGCHVGQDIPAPKDTKSLNILVIHAPISLEKAAFAHFNAKSFLHDNPKYNLILCGDIHKKFVYEEKGAIICNTGPMIRKTVAEWNHEPTFFVYDTDNQDLVEVTIPHEAAEQVLSREHIEVEERREGLMQKFIDKVGKVKMGSTKLVKNITKFLKANDMPQEVKEILDGLINE